MNVIERLFNNANNNHGLVLQPMQVRELAGTFMNMDRAVQELQYVTERYVAEYGDTLLRSILGGKDGNTGTPDHGGEGDTEAEIVEEGQTDEGPGLHSQVEEVSGPSVEVPEVSDN